MYHPMISLGPRGGVMMVCTIVSTAVNEVYAVYADDDNR